MSGLQKTAIFVLVIITAVYVYFSFFGENNNLFNFREREQRFNPQNNASVNDIDEEVVNEKINTQKIVKIFILNENGTLRSVNRTYKTDMNVSETEFLLKELINAPSNWELSKGFSSEIPKGTKILSVRESKNNVIVDLSSEFEFGGGTESVYLRLKQLIKTVKSNTNKPVYLFINGKEATAIGGEGIMLKQPLSERSLDE